MKIQGQKLKALMAERGMTSADVAAQVSATQSAVRNWSVGNDHPRCKASDVSEIAGVLGCGVKDIVRFTSEVRHHRGSPRKARLVADMIRGKGVVDAANMLRFSTKRAAVNMGKALNAALEEAINSGVDTDLLVVSESRVDEGPHIKRFQPKDRGRAHPILKRTSHITISVEEKA